MLKQCREASSLGIVIFLWVTNLLVLFPCGTGFAQAPDTLWTRTYGGGLGIVVIQFNKPLMEAISL